MDDKCKCGHPQRMHTHWWGVCFAKAPRNSPYAGTTCPCLEYDNAVPETDASADAEGSND